LGFGPTPRWIIFIAKTRLPNLVCRKPGLLWAGLVLRAFFEIHPGLKWTVPNSGAF